MRGESIIVKQLLQKAKDSALLAVEFYNKPAVSFKSEGFIVMMCIAWTSLLHAYFFKNRIKPFYRKTEKGKRPRFEKKIEILSNGSRIEDYKWWELSECIKKFFKNEHNAVRYNLEFFSGIRNIIVHRNLPELDATLFAECQANILNFNNFLMEHFGEKHRIDYMLSYSLQMFKEPKNFLDATKNELQKKHAYEIVNFIRSFRSSLSTEIIESPEYSYKAVLIQVKNHQSKDALPIKFIHEKDLTDEQKQALGSAGIVLIKEKIIKEDGIPDGFIDYKELTARLKEKIPDFKANDKYHKIRKEIISNNPELYHERKLDPKNKKSQKKPFFNPRIIEKIEEQYNEK